MIQRYQIEHLITYTAENVAAKHSGDNASSNISFKKPCLHQAMNLQTLFP